MNKVQTAPSEGAISREHCSFARGWVSLAFTIKVSRFDNIYKSA